MTTGRSCPYAPADDNIACVHGPVVGRRSLYFAKANRAAMHLGVFGKPDDLASAVLRLTAVNGASPSVAIMHRILARCVGSHRCIGQSPADSCFASVWFGRGIRRKLFECSIRRDNRVLVLSCHSGIRVCIPGPPFHTHWSGGPIACLGRLGSHVGFPPTTGKL